MGRVPSTTLLNMFRGTSAFNSDISKWDVSSVMNLAYTFVLTTV